MKKFISFVLLLASLDVSAQLSRIGGGLAFSSGVDYNHHRTGNPGIRVKSYFEVFPKMNFVPSVTIFNRYKKSTFTESIRNYMFHGDADFQYEVFKQDEIRIIVEAGLNATGLISRYEMLVYTGGEGLDNKSDLGLGLNAGAGLEMMINDSYDATLTAKYIAGRYSQFVINLGVVYFLHPVSHRSRR